MPEPDITCAGKWAPTCRDHMQKQISFQVGSLYLNGDLGFGLGFEIVTDLGRSGRAGSVGQYSWGSAYYSRYFVDPQEELVALFLTQLIPAGSVDLNDRFRYLVYQAIVGPVATSMK